MDATPWLQDVGMVKQPSSTLEVSSSTRPPQPPPPQQQQLLEKRARPQKEQALNCPRCNSTNTKFCYYNNYSLTQPRYFCKTCRRYWTEGGSLRNVPVGGGSRKNKRSSSSSTPSTSSAAPSKKFQPDHLGIPAPPLENPKFLEAHDLNLSFPHHPLQQGDFSARFPALKNQPSTDGLSAMELLRSGSGMGSFLPMHMQEVVYPQGGFVLQDFRSTTVGFPVEGIGVNSSAAAGTNGGGYENIQEVEGANGGRVLFPVEDLSQVPPSRGTAAGFDQRQGDSSGFWNGVMGSGGASW